MRVRPLRPTRTASTAERRPHVIERPAVPAPVAPAPEQHHDEEHHDERRHRECVASEDTALYSCSCGFQFTAAVTTSVACPHCGTAQAW